MSFIASPSPTTGEGVLNQRDYLWLHLRELPYFRAMLRAVEARFYADISLPAPTLDLGCGDGHFASLAFYRRLEVGVDPWSGPLRQAAERGVYQLALRGYGDALPFADACFASAVSNSVLEHIPDLDPVLAEMGRVLRPGAVFVFCVPNQHFLEHLSIAQGLDRLGLRSLAQAYRSFFNRISRHHHCDSPETWQQRLDKAGFEVLKWWHYFSPQALHVFEWGHYLGAACLLPHFLLRRWIIAPYRWNLLPTLRFVQRFYEEEPVNPDGVYSFYITRRR